MVEDKRLYLIPVRDSCNSDCSFCYMKEKEKDFTKPQFIDYSNLKKTLNPIWNNFKEVEITGGGEPTLHKDISKIVNLFEDKYVKMYTNGFFLKDVGNLNEVNISRVHFDSKINNKFYNSKFQNNLDDVLDFYLGKVDKIRIQTILLDGAIDTSRKLEEFISKYESLVDEFMVRRLFDNCDLEKDKEIKYFDFNHPKLKWDNTLDNYSRELYFVGTDLVIHEGFQY